MVVRACATRGMLMVRITTRVDNLGAKGTNNVLQYMTLVTSIQGFEHSDGLISFLML
jgi:hypothetical protein